MFHAGDGIPIPIPTKIAVGMLLYHKVACQLRYFVCGSSHQIVPLYLWSPFLLACWMCCMPLLRATFDLFFFVSSSSFRRSRGVVLSLVFCLCSPCHPAGYQYCRIDGNTPHDTRQDLIEEYNAPVR